MGRTIPGSASPALHVGIQPDVSTTDLTNCPVGTISALVWNVPGVAGVKGAIRTFKFCYASFSVSMSFNPGQMPTDHSGTMSLLTAVVLPDLTSWTFVYDSYADVTRVGLPTGGYIS
jgi:hypothetical protein